MTRDFRFRRLANLALGLSLGALSLGTFPAAAFQTSAGDLVAKPQVEGLSKPWGFALLPGGAILITEIEGRLLLRPEAGGAVQPVGGLPRIMVGGQGGLLDVMVPRDFADSREVWLSFVAPADGGGIATAAGFGRLAADGSRLEGFKTVFSGTSAIGGRHFGSRLLEGADGRIYLTTGDRGTGPEGREAQDPALSHGKVIVLNRDGSPAINQEGWLPGALTLGHRNIQGIAEGPAGQILTVEHGARGGDEVNLLVPGGNFGWPVISYGRNYNGASIGEGTEKAGMLQPIHYWDPSIAPSGMVVYSGRMIPDWAGDLLIGSLNSDFIARLDPEQAAATGYAEERLQSPETGRVRDIREADDGAIWFLSESTGTLYRLAPEGK